MKKVTVGKDTRVDIQSSMKDLFGGSCYAYCIAWLSGIEDIASLTFEVLNAWKNGWIEDDGFVSKPVEYYNHLFSEACKDVKKEDYKAEAYNQIVEWRNGSVVHFVVMRNGKVVFDPAGFSTTVARGKPVSVRRFV